MRMREHRQKLGRKSDMTSEKLKAMLIDIYLPKVDFSIVLTDRKYKGMLGTYYPDRHRIYVHGGWETILNVIFRDVCHILTQVYPIFAENNRLIWLRTYSTGIYGW